MSIHPNPMSMAVHVEHHRQTLLDQARQERLAKEAIAGAARAHQGSWEVRAAVAGRARLLFSRLRSGLSQPLEPAQSSPGDVL
jgi:hypothetical protein